MWYKISLLIASILLTISALGRDYTLIICMPPRQSAIQYFHVRDDFTLDQPFVELYNGAEEKYSNPMTTQWPFALDDDAMDAEDTEAYMHTLNGVSQVDIQANYNDDTTKSYTIKTAELAPIKYRGRYYERYVFICPQLKNSTAPWHESFTKRSMNKNINYCQSMGCRYYNYPVPWVINN